MNFVYMAFNVAKTQLRMKGVDEFTEEHLGFLYHTLFNKYNHVFATYGQLIICHEGKGSLDWRREIYPDYKRNRDKGKADPSYAVLKSSFQVIEDLLDLYPCKQIKVKGAEADDNIYAIARKYGEMGEDVVILSSDGDLAQILDYSDTISLYSPVKKVFSDKKPRIVDFKAIVGDPSDNIPGVYRLGKKTFEKMIEDRTVWNEKLKGDNHKVYEKFLQIVDLEVFPKECHDEAIRQVEELPFNEFNTGQIELFFYENDMMDQLTRWGNTQRGITETLLETGVKVIDFEKSSTPVTSDAMNDTTEDELSDILSEFC